jgi:hypothetical protein
MAPEVKTAKNSKLPKLSENCFESVGKGGWPLISIWIIQGEEIHPNTSLENCKISNFHSLLGVMLVNVERHGWKA